LSSINTSLSTLHQPVTTGYFNIEQHELLVDTYNDQAFNKTEPLALLPQQKQAIEPIHQKIREEEHDVFLLHGITGCGKTEIYLQAIQHVVEEGKEAIVLVPEIALTPQMVTRFKER